MELRHGTTTCYVHNRCRCLDCKAAWNDYKKDYDRRKKAELKQVKKDYEDLKTLLAEMESALSEYRSVSE